MRKFILVLSILCLAAAAISCSSEEDTAPVVLSGGQSGTSQSALPANEERQTEEAGEDISYDAYVFDYNGVIIRMNEPAQDVIDALGDGYSYFEAPSCAYEGMDKVYTYNSVVVRSYTRDGEDYIAAVELKDDTVQTSEGIRIGAAEEDVRASYEGEPQVNPSGLEYTKGDSFISFIFENGKVAAITYTAIVG